MLKFKKTVDVPVWNVADSKDIDYVARALHTQGHFNGTVPTVFAVAWGRLMAADRTPERFGIFLDELIQTATEMRRRLVVED